MIAIISEHYFSTCNFINRISSHVKLF